MSSITIHLCSLHVPVENVYISSSRRQHTGPSINKVNDAITVDGDVLLCDHLYYFLCDYTSQERGNVRKVSSGCADAADSVSACSFRVRMGFTSRRQHLKSPSRQAQYQEPRQQCARGARSLWVRQFAWAGMTATHQAQKSPGAWPSLSLGC